MSVKKDSALDRRRMMVQQVREGASERAVSRSFRVSLSTVQRWVNRASGLALEEVDWSDRPPGCGVSSRRTQRKVERRVLQIRKILKNESALGEYGPEAILREMESIGESIIPSAATIGRILSRNGAIDCERRVRRPSPPPGWYLPTVSRQSAEIDNFDAIEDLVIEGGIDVNVLTAISLHGGLCGAWPVEQITAKTVVERLLEHWREVGLPEYAKFDNGSVFHGCHRWPDSFGRVTRLCLSLKVTPVFAPPLCRGFQANIEHFNGRWQKVVWQRHHFHSLEEVVAESKQFIDAHRQRHAVRIEDAPKRRRIPKGWNFTLRAPLKGEVIYIRESNGKGEVKLLGHTYDVCPTWIHRLVRAEVDLTVGQIRFYSLRRKDPTNHHLLGTRNYVVPKKRFLE